MEAEGIVEKLKSTLNEMAATTPMTYVGATGIGDQTIL